MQAKARLPPGFTGGAARLTASRGELFALPEYLADFRGGAGQPLAKSVRQEMESLFGTSFADVRVHVGPQAGSIGALAFTHGSNLYFAPGQYDPASRRGQQLLGHELTHVVQQRAGRVRNPLGSGVVVLLDRGMEAEADRMGLRAASLPPPAIQAKPARPASYRALVAGSVVQRAAEPVKKKAPRKPHSTAAGKIKASTIQHLKNLPKGTLPSEVIAIWEVHHQMFDEFISADPDGLPANTTGNLPAFLDLASLTENYYVLGTILTAGIPAALQASRGGHGNGEGKLPVYALPAAPYEEFGYLKGGARLVVDHTSNRRYISLHYSTFYRIS